MTEVSDNRAKRIALMHGYELGYSHILKTIVKDKPMTAILISGVVSILGFSYCMRVCERPLTDILNDQTFENLSSSAWMVVITMMTGSLG